MEHIPIEIKTESLKSFQSTISKCQNAMAQMLQKGSNTTLLQKRLNALTIGLALLEYHWNQKPHSFTQENLVEARMVLIDLLSSVENIDARLKPGSPQRTLLERRIKSMQLAVQAIDDFLIKTSQTE